MDRRRAGAARRAAGETPARCARPTRGTNEEGENAAHVAASRHGASTADATRILARVLSGSTAEESSLFGGRLSFVEVLMGQVCINSFDQ